MSDAKILEFPAQPGAIKVGQLWRSNKHPNQDLLRIEHLSDTEAFCLGIITGRRLAISHQLLRSWGTLEKDVP